MTIQNQIDGRVVTALEGTTSYALRFLAEFYRTYYKAALSDMGFPLFGEAAVGNFAKADDIWQAELLPIFQTYDEAGLMTYAGAYIEQRMAMALIRTGAKRVSFECRYNGTVNNVTNPETGAIEISMLQFVATPVPVRTDNQIVQLSSGLGENPEGSVYALSLTSPAAADWTKIELDLSAMPSPPEGHDRWAFAFLILCQGVRKGYEEPFRDWSEDYLEIRNVVVSPPDLALYSPSMGSVSSSVPVSNLSLSEGGISYFAGRFHRASVAALSLLPGNIFSGVTRTELSAAGDLSLTANNPAYSWSVPRYQLGLAQIIYTMTLTGSPDIEIPISSFQSVVRQGGATIAELINAAVTYNEQVANLEERISGGGYSPSEIQSLRADILTNYANRIIELRESRPSYLSCVVPNFVDYIDEIQARTSGEVVIKRGYLMPDGSRNLEEIIRTNFEYVTYDQGARSASASITAYKVQSFRSPKRREITGVSYVGADSQGRRRLRATMDLFLRPEDTCIYGDGEEMRVGTITYIVDDRSAVMHVTEQDETF